MRFLLGEQNKRIDLLEQHNFDDVYYRLLRFCVLFSGVAFIGAGLLFNTYFFEKYVSLDGSLEVSTKRMIVFFQLGFVVVGVAFFVLYRRMNFFLLKNRNMLMNLSLLFFSLIIILCVAEFSLRAVSPRQKVFAVSGTDPAVFQDSGIIPWELKPNASDRFVALDFDTVVSINSLGLRGAEQSINKSKDTFRILVLGDSMTYGFGVENNETYSAILENLLNTEGVEKQVEVWNAGFTAGYSPDTFYLYLREKGMNFHPDLVLVGLFVENDIIDIRKNTPVVNSTGKIIKIKSDFYRVQNNRLRRGFIENEPSFFQRMQLHFKGLLLKYSKLYSYLSQKLSLFLTRENNPIFDKSYSEEVNKNFEQVDFYLGEMKTLADENGIKLAVVFLPGKASVDELWQSYVKKNPESSREKPRQVLQSSCNRHNISCADIWPEFMNLNDTASIFFEHDGHWNTQGQRYAAELIEDFLVTEQLVS